MMDQGTKLWIDWMIPSRLSNQYGFWGLESEAGDETIGDGRQRRSDGSVPTAAFRQRHSDGGVPTAPLIISWAEVDTNPVS